MLFGFFRVLKFHILFNKHPYFTHIVKAMLYSCNRYLRLVFQFRYAQSAVIIVVNLWENTKYRSRHVNKSGNERRGENLEHAFLLLRNTL